MNPLINNTKVRWTGRKNEKTDNLGNIFFFVIFSIHSEYRVYPAYGKIYSVDDSNEIDRNQYREVTFQEADEIYDNAIKNRKTDSLRDMKFKTKCHITSITKIPSANWKNLSLYCDGKRRDNFIVPKGYLLPDLNCCMMSVLPVYVMLLPIISGYGKIHPLIQIKQDLF